MAEERDSIPAAMRREVMVESGGRCAIPTCRHQPVEIAHIEPWSKVRKHEVHNLIVLCRNCHFSYDHNGPIDQLGMKQIKANLSVVTNRYGDLERRVLEVFAKNPEVDAVPLPGGLDLMMYYLMQDGYVQKIPSPNNKVWISGQPAEEAYVITPSGRQFIARWLDAKPLE